MSNIEPYVVIDLEAIKHNVEKVREYAPTAKIMAVIKSNAYGHGLLQIAKELDDVDGLAVARISEAVRLRKAGITKKVVILSGFFSEEQLKEVTEFQLDIVVHSMEQVKVLRQCRGQQKITVWLKHNSGMNRLGFSATEFEKAYQEFEENQYIDSNITLMTHLSSADDLKSSVTEQQIKRFKSTVKKYSGETSIANSAGLIGYSNSVTDWVRPGLMLYGISPFLDKYGSEIGLKPVMSLFAPILAVKEVAAGESVGYSGAWVSKKKTTIAVVGVGYGDGYPRHAKNGTPVLVNGQRVPLIGRVSMDMITVDLSSQSNARPGDIATLWGKGLAVEEVAKYADTIPYTLLCGITQRVKIKNG
jgi:alanine racemase